MFSSSGEPGEAPWGCLEALGNLLGLESLGDFKASPGCLLGAIGRLGEDNYTNLEATWSPKQPQAGDCVLSQNIAKLMLFPGFGSFFSSGESENREIAATGG